MTGENKKLNFPVYKGIRINEKQAKRWDTETIRNFLDNGKQLSIDTQILKKLILPFAKAGIKVDLEDSEIKRIQELMEMIK